MTQEKPEPNDPTSDRLFVEGGPDWESNACLNWAASQLGVYADGYREAASLLVEHALGPGATQDTLVYPVVFLYRHYVELRLKWLVANLQHLLGQAVVVRPIHHIDRLWLQVLELLREAGIVGADAATFQRIGMLISEWSVVDRNAESFRYPYDNRGQDSLPGIERINLRNLNEKMNEISNLLDGLSELVIVAQDAQYEERMQERGQADF